MFKKCVAMAAVLVWVCPVLHAQGGCVNSPENPTAVLALAGAAGAAWRVFSRRGR